MKVEVKVGVIGATADVVQVRTSGGEVVARVEGDVIIITQNDHPAGVGRMSAKGRIEDCAARLGAADGSETESVYEAIEAALARCKQSEALAAGR